MPEYYPPVGFFFRVNFVGSEFSAETSFQEVSGLTVELQMEEHVEGGELRFVHRLPKTPRYSNLILKRGLVKNSAMRQWVEKAVHGFTFSPVTAQVSLLDEKSNPLMSWTAYNVRPAKWEITPLNAKESNDVVVETLELVIDYFEAA